MRLQPQQPSPAPTWRTERSGNAGLRDGQDGVGASSPRCPVPPKPGPRRTADERGGVTPHVRSAPAAVPVRALPASATYASQAVAVLRVRREVEGRAGGAGRLNAEHLQEHLQEQAQQEAQRKMIERLDMGWYIRYRAGSWALPGLAPGSAGASFPNPLRRTSNGAPTARSAPSAAPSTRGSSRTLSPTATSRSTRDPKCPRRSERDGDSQDTRRETLEAVLDDAGELAAGDILVSARR